MTNAHAEELDGLLADLYDLQERLTGLSEVRLIEIISTQRGTIRATKARLADTEAAYNDAVAGAARWEALYTRLSNATLDYADLLEGRGTLDNETPASIATVLRLLGVAPMVEARS